MGLRHSPWCGRQSCLVCWASGHTPGAEAARWQAGRQVAACWARWLALPAVTEWVQALRLQPRAVVAGSRKGHLRPAHNCTTPLLLAPPAACGLLAGRQHKCWVGYARACMCVCVPLFGVWGVGPC
jgi:hypothetical protein